MSQPALAIVPSGDRFPTSAKAEIVSATILAVFFLGLTIQWTVPMAFMERLVLFALGAQRSFHAWRYFRQLN